MFFSRDIYKKTKLTAESVCEFLSLPRIVYGQALLDWYVEISKFPQGVIKNGYSSTDNSSQLVIPNYQQKTRDKITDQKILNCLKNGPLDTLSITRKILGRTMRRRPISTILYRMASDGKIIYQQTDGLDIWELTMSEPIFPIIVPPVPSAALG